jgi:hypothetical protein
MLKANAHVIVYVIGWLVFVLTQANNSIKSTTNGLRGSAGWVQWLKLHAVDLIARAFFSAMSYGFIINQVSSKLAAVGFPFTSTTIAGFAGFCANALLYQVFGMIPWLRVEVGVLAPPEKVG